MMTGQAVEVNWNDMSEAIPAFLTFFIMLLTFSISNGVLLGLLSAGLLRLSSGQVCEDCFPNSSATHSLLASELELLRSSGGDINSGTNQSYHSGDSKEAATKGDYALLA
mmetsp:Transcript_10916/g.15018  ORF Transcript_10916/g.15018 Transcript_10916/m.15018 type:complete len:110 (-) Transcript_10916:61-390(-)